VPQTKPPYPLEFREHALALLAVSARARAVGEGAKGAAGGAAGAGGRAGASGGAGAGEGAGAGPGAGAKGAGGAEGRAAARPLAQIARELGVSAQTLHAWRRRAEVEKRQAEVDAGMREGLWDGEREGVPEREREGLRSEEREELRALRKENLSLRNEREILLKAGVFFAQETGK
jgi:transposase-like protein